MHSANEFLVDPSRPISEVSGRESTSAGTSAEAASPSVDASGASTLPSGSAPRGWVVSARERAEAETSLAAVLSVVLGVGGASLLLHGMTAPGSACTTLGVLALASVGVVQARAVFLSRRLLAAQGAGEQGAPSREARGGLPS